MKFEVIKYISGKEDLTKLFKTIEAVMSIVFNDTEKEIKDGYTKGIMNVTMEIYADMEKVDNEV